MTRSRDSRGVVLPSPVVMLSVVAVAMAAIAFVVTRGGEPTEREITPVAAPETTASATAEPTPTAAAEPAKQPPAIKRGKTYVVVFNNSGVTGLAATVGEKASKAGWNVVGADNWYGNVPESTVYYPKRLEAEGKQLALDLGIKRTAPAVDPMKMDRLTIILTGPLG